MRRSIPFTVPAVATLALLAWASPAVSGLLVYDRALVAEGEVWRVATSALVHWSLRHLVLDVGVVLVAGAALERLIGPRIIALIALSALVSGLAVHLAPPWFDRYGGLSAVAYTLVAVLAITGTSGDGWRRAACLTTLGVLAAKLIVETMVDAPLLAGGMGGAVTATASHAAGLALAFAVGLRRTIFPGGMPSPSR